MTQRSKTPAGLVSQASKFILAVLLAAPVASEAQTNMAVYSNALVNGWLDYSYNVTRNFANTSPVYSGSTHSISATITNAYGGIQLYHAPMADSNYASISFWLNGGATGGQSLQMYGNLGTGPTGQSPRYSLITPQANTWQQYVVLLADLGVSDQTNFSGFAIQDSAGSTEPTFYLDAIQLVSGVAPAVTALTVNAGLPIRTADARWFGLNSAIWDSYFDTPDTIALLTNMGVQALRYPGGSAADNYHWVSNGQNGGGYTASTASPASFIQVITNIGGESMITMNYGTGTSNEAAAWVAYVNAATTNTVSLGVDQYGINWQTAGYWASLRAAAPLKTNDGKNFLRISRTAPLGFEYWEVGNEVYGASWETDSNVVPHDPYTYAVRSGGYIGLIKAVDPAAKIGVVVETGEDSFVNNTDHLVTNPVTGQTHYGWTPVLLTTLKSRGVTPDFAIFHNYPQNPGGENDAALLASSDPPSGWAYDAANLRMMLTDYMGSTGSNTELVCTENNSVSSSPGKQSVSLVNGLYKLDSLAQLMQTEFNGFFWWDLRNGQETDGNLSSSLYGWREYGDYGVMNEDSDLGQTDLYPTYYTTELTKDFVQTGDTVITAASDYSLLTVYAARRQNGSLTVLAINKDPVNTLNGQVSLTGFNPASGGVVYSYGIPQDDAVESDTGSPNIAQTSISVTGTNITYAFPPYSATVLALSPAPAKLLTTSIPPTASQFVFQLQGQAGVPYVIERSTNLTTWTAASTNTLAASTMNITNALAPAATKQFWRAVWQP
jgi:alpha-L-arabinofuranosidase